MCFYLNNAMDFQNAKLALDDITVYKLFKVKDGVIRSPFRSCTWKIGCIKNTHLKTRAYYTIDKGLHSFITVSGARNFHFRDGAHILLKCVIPAGAYYFKNGTQYVSNELVVLDDKPVSMKLKRKR